MTSEPDPSTTHDTPASTTGIGSDDEAPRAERARALLEAVRRDHLIRSISQGASAETWAKTEPAVLVVWSYRVALRHAATGGDVGSILAEVWKELAEEMYLPLVEGGPLVDTDELAEALSHPASIDLLEEIAGSPNETTPLPEHEPEWAGPAREAIGTDLS